MKQLPVRHRTLNKVGRPNLPAIFVPMPDIRQLLHDSYSCSRCPEMFGFSISPNGGYFKFPPIIGATGKADILFVGINPRRSDTNLHLHQSLMTSQSGVP
jgi:hypothetical protein